MKIVGKILWWDARDKEGIAVDADGNEYYFNYSVFPEHSKLKVIEGRFVQFQVNRRVKHMLCAAGVTVVPVAATSKAKRTFEKSAKSRTPEVAA